MIELLDTAPQCNGHKNFTKYKEVAISAIRIGGIYG